jgi:SAM-dependent methyltransferase
VRQISDPLIKEHASRRFRSEYDYALFEYYRSAKVLAYLHTQGARLGGRVLDAGCGGGGMPLSFAEEAAAVVGIDLVNRFGDAGVRLAAERGRANLHFAQADGQWLPFPDRAFDWVFSHAVIEHVADAARYLAECARVLRPGGRMYLSTAPYLSFAGAHLPRLKVPVPLHLLLGRQLAFRTFRFLARHAEWTLKERADENSFIKIARADGRKDDDLLELVRIRRLRARIAAAGLRILDEDLYVTGTFRRLPAPLMRALRDSALSQDVVIGHDRYRPDDRRAVDALYRRVFGNDAAEASRLRWEWQYRRNPNNPGGTPVIWVAREGRTIVGQYATMPVRLRVGGDEVDGSWGMDVMVAPERQRQGIGEVLFRTWDRNVGAALGLGLSDSSHRLFRKLRWHEAGPVPCLVKPLTRRALKRGEWPEPVNRLVSAVTLPAIRVIARSRPMQGEVAPVDRFSHDFTEVWDRLADRFAFAVRRDASYLNWKYVEAPHVRYHIAVLRRDGRVEGYVVYRHLQEARGRVTSLVDFLVDPEDAEGFTSLLRWVDREARDADSDKIRTFCLHTGFRRLLRRSGYFVVKSTVEFTVKVNGVEVPPDFYAQTESWHVTLGDSDLDR